MYSPRSRPSHAPTRSKIRLIEGNAKCCHLKKLTYKGTLRQVFICLRPRTPYPPSPTHFKRVYGILIHRSIFLDDDIRFGVYIVN
jgi:hypothetical protein